MHTRFTHVLILVLIVLGLAQACKKSSTSNEPDEPQIELNIPSLLSPENGADNQASFITLRWQAISGAERYHVQIADNASFSAIQEERIDITKTYQQFSGLDTDITYYWRVRALADDAASEWSEPYSFSVEQVVEIAPQTKVIDENEVDEAIVNTVDSLQTITFNADSEYAQNLKEGDIIVAGISEKLPFGALRKVSSVSNKVRNSSTQSSTIIVVTEEVPLEEAFETTAIQQTTTLSAQNIISQKLSYSGVRVNKHPAFINSDEFYLEIREVIHDADGDRSTTNDQVKLNGSIRFAPDFTQIIDIQRFRLQKMHFSIDADFQSTLTFSSSVGTSIDWPLKVAEFTLGHIPAGPIIIFPQIEIWVGAKGQIGATLYTGVEYASQAEAGITFERDRSPQWVPISELNQEANFIPLTARLGASVQAYAKVDFIALLYGGVGPYVSMKGYGQFDVTPIEDPWWKLYWGLEASAGVKLKLFSRNIADKEFLAVIGYRNLLAQAEPNSYPEITLQAPNGGERWAHNSTQNIRWEDNIDENVRIELWRGGSRAATIAESTESDGLFEWTISSDLAAQSDYVLRIASVDDVEIRDDIDAQFAIIVENTGGGGSGEADYTNSIGMEFVYVAAGSFQMGSNDGFSDERPVHEVEITQGYYIGKFEVTQAQWQEIMGNNPSYFQAWRVGSEHLSHPVERVSWNDIQTFVQRLNEREGGTKYRLPTEAEWEYAARGGQQSQGYTYAGSNDVNEVTWYPSNSSGRTHHIGTKAPNELGIYDMSGNVFEWCEDWYDREYYSQSPRQDPHGPSSGLGRVLRGGSWGDGSYYTRVTYRGDDFPTIRSKYVGFRLLRAAD